MKKLSFLLVALLVSWSVYAANTIEYRDKSVVVTSSQIATTALNNTTAIDLGAYDAGSVQCVWAAVAGTQPVFNLQVSNDGTNYDNVSGATTTTTGAAGSSTFLVQPFVSRYARIYVATSSTAGTLDCKSVLYRP